MAEKRNPVAEARAMSDAEIVAAINEAHREMFNLRMRHATRQLDNHQALSRARKQIARLKTIQTERRLGMRRG